MKSRLLIALALLLFTTAAFAGIRRPGSYSGVVIFDRWDTCTLYSGVYVTYISERIKSDFLLHAQEAIEIDATVVRQVENPGDAVILEYASVGSVADRTGMNSVDGLSVTAAYVAPEGALPSIEVAVRNDSGEVRRLNWSDFALTLFAHRSQEPLAYEIASDGESYAMITRKSVWGKLKETRYQDGLLAATPPFEWIVEANTVSRESFLLMPEKEHVLRVTFLLKKGEYDFLAGYGGGVHATRPAVSNLVAFDVRRDGVGEPARIPGR